MYSHCFKRIFDFLISLVALMIVSPVLLNVAILLLFFNKGAGVFFVQRRPGRYCKEFKLIKFKTMTDERDSDGRLLPDAPRLTRFGRFLRATSIDELPQLINVLKGDMSFIGPRPLLRQYIPYYSEVELLRHTVRPGISGWAQVHGRNHVIWEERFAYDVYYVQHLSFALDFQIFMMTIKNVLNRKDIEVVTNMVDFDEYRCSQLRDKVFLRIEDGNIGSLSMKIVRDDLFPSFGGGSKARKVCYYERFIQEGGYNAIVTCGGVHSNHNRAVALMAMKNNWPCHLVYHGNKEAFMKGRGNVSLVRCSGAQEELVETDRISETMDKAMDSFRNVGLNPYYIHGGGHDLPGGIAFVEAIREFKTQADRFGYKPDYIFLATGTGSTQAGLVVGLDLVGWSDVKVVGISVARPCHKGRKIVVDFADMLSKYYHLEKDFSDSIIFIDDYVGDGYDIVPEGLISFSKRVYAQTGLLVDNTYSGKALFGMQDYIKSNRIKGNFVFWMTGGPLNAVS